MLIVQQQWPPKHILAIQQSIDDIFHLPWQPSWRQIYFARANMSTARSHKKRPFTKEGQFILACPAADRLMIKLLTFLYWIVALLMTGFGDASHPVPESVNLMEDMLMEYLFDLVSYSLLPIVYSQGNSFASTRMIYSLNSARNVKTFQESSRPNMCCLHWERIQRSLQEHRSCWEWRMSCGLLDRHLMWMTLAHNELIHRSLFRHNQHVYKLQAFTLHRRLLFTYDA